VVVGTGDNCELRLEYASACQKLERLSNLVIVKLLHRPTLVAAVMPRITAPPEHDSYQLLRNRCSLTIEMESIKPAARKCVFYTAHPHPR
jgi:hypothetical protein